MAFSTKEELLERIKAVFPDEPWPKGQVTSDCDCYECQECNEAVKGHRWSEITPQLACRYYKCISLADDQGFRHLLPAFMSCALIDCAETDVAVQSLAWAYLSHKGRSIDFLTRPQAEALCDWLEWNIRDEELEHDEWKEHQDDGCFLQKWVLKKVRTKNDRMWARLEKLREEASRMSK